MSYWIIDMGEKSALNFKSVSSGTSLPLPIRADDAKHLIAAAFQAPDDNPRAEFQGVLADKMVHGVRVRVVGQQSHFDIPWSAIAQGQV